MRPRLGLRPPAGAGVDLPNGLKRLKKSKMPDGGGGSVGFTDVFTDVLIYTSLIGFSIYTILGVCEAPILER